MKLIVGLGNPGEKYLHNRHNAGFMVVDRITEIRDQRSEARWEKKFDAEILRLGEALLAKPQTFMNRSGEVVKNIVSFYKVEPGDLWIIHDDLDIRLGEYKIQNGVGPKIHNGITSVESNLGRKDFWRLRVGVDNRDQRSEFRIQGEDYVLADFADEEMIIIKEVINKAAHELNSLLG